jgi:hypothetical protein
MSNRITKGFTAIGVMTTLVLAGNTVSMAATGDGFLLGKRNNADRVSIIERTTAGAALRLKTLNDEDPPFSTNGHGMVKHLNADKLDGLDSTELRDATTLQGRTAEDLDDAKTLDGRTPADLDDAATFVGYDLREVMFRARHATWADGKTYAKEVQVYDVPLNQPLPYSGAELDFDLTLNGASGTSTCNISEEAYEGRNLVKHEFPPAASSTSDSPRLVGSAPIFTYFRTYIRLICRSETPFSVTGYTYIDSPID